jgi:hypothetical protein
MAYGDGLRLPLRCQRGYLEMNQWPKNVFNLKAKETKKCLHRDVDDDDLVEFYQL